MNTLKFEYIQTPPLSLLLQLVPFVSELFLIIASCNTACSRVFDVLLLLLLLLLMMMMMMTMILNRMFVHVGQCRVTS